MRIEDVIRKKGREVVTVAPESTVAELVQLLGERNIGAVVVSSDGKQIEGIVSERDVVRGLAHTGADVLQQTVAELMTREVNTIGPEDEIESAAATMTVERVRHMPVVVDGRLVAIVSIGDVVKHRIDQLIDERNHLLGYLHA